MCLARKLETLENVLVLSQSFEKQCGRFTFVLHKQTAVGWKTCHVCFYFLTHHNWKLRTMIFAWWPDSVCKVQYRTGQGAVLGVTAIRSRGAKVIQKWGKIPKMCISFWRSQNMKFILPMVGAVFVYCLCLLIKCL